MIEATDRRWKRGRRLALFLSVMLSFCCWSWEGGVFAASSDPALRYTISTKDAMEQLEAGDSITVTVDIAREDKSADPYSIYGIQIDLTYDEELFEVSDVEGPGELRPDGTAWKGSWSCHAIGSAGRKKIRVLYTNLSLVGGMQNTEQVSGEIQAGKFTLTVKEGAPQGGSSEIGFAYAERVNSELKKGDCVTSSPLKLTFAGTAPDSGSGSEGNGSGGTGSGTGGGSGSAGGGSGNSGTGGFGTGGSATDGASPGTPAGGANSETTDGGAGGAGKVAFSDLTDVNDTYWAAKAIRGLLEKGVMSGEPDHRFHPEKNVTRAEFASIAARAFQYETAGPSGAGNAGEAGQGTGVFRDVKPGDWYFEPVMALYQAGIISGTGTGQFGAEQPLSRQDMTVILHYILQARNRILDPNREYREFQDESQIADYARQAVEEFYRAGVISGVGGRVLAPEQTSTRAQAASVVYQILQELEEGR